MTKKMSAQEELMMSQAGEASRRRFWTHTVAVINGIRVVGQDPMNPGKCADAEDFGTGLVAQWSDHRFILTAKHVLENATPSNLRIFWCPGGVIEQRRPAELRTAIL